MNTKVEKLRENFKELHVQLERDAEKARQKFRYTLENGKVTFEEEARRRGRELRVRLMVFLRRTRPWELITAPFIYGLIVPFALLDLFVTVYQSLCFPVYGLPKVKRTDHIAIDRHKLTYLNFMQKLNCVFCGYCNGLLTYVTEVAGRTEYYWCPVKHARHMRNSHGHVEKFLEYGDGESWDQVFLEMKDNARACDGCDGCH